jgi:hypothetical protein
MKSGNLNFLEPSESLQACNGTALPFTISDMITKLSKMIKRLTYTVVLLTVMFVRVEFVLGVMMNFVIVRFAREFIFTAHEAHLLITVWEISYGQVGSFPEKTACLIILLGFIFVIEFPLSYLIEIDRFE